MGRLASAVRLSRRWFGGRKVESTMSTQLQSISQTATLTLYVTVPVVTMRHRNVRTSAKVADSLPPNREDTGGVPRIPFQNPRLYIRVLELTKTEVDEVSTKRTCSGITVVSSFDLFCTPGCKVEPAARQDHVCCGRVFANVFLCFIWVS